MAEIVFPFRFHPAFRVAVAPLGVQPSSARVVVADDALVARFGPWVVRTALDNVAGAEVGGPYAWPKVIGPPHLSFADRGLTFATNPERGVCIRFHRSVRGIDPLGWLRHPSLTVTVADAPALAELLDRDAHGDLARGPATAEELLSETEDELSSLTAAELRERAREQGLSGVSRLSKRELVEALEPGSDSTRT
ncbi:Rho termination factor N-terminal domain-containing protein [Dermatobacter hominis]|uniref:Rho termination factor N-terminal domain-containing protein n=1 Tax=Dermatobacter hominis TaxID=2884263 RepID=UPI001D1292CF|nr:Rho termination factor N-terminal domain-containing protein [Dermatobacter hominis]UDY37483.1 Rho termination factor N-terminal domain-containing protein [Dermatobacter hominis]